MYDALIKVMDDETVMTSMHRVATEIREQQVRGLQLLSEIDERRLFLREGYASLWAYCIGALKMSESGASRWTRAMRAVRRDAELLAKLADGRVSLCVVATLADQPQLLEKAEGKTIREAREMLTIAAAPVEKKVPAAPLDGMLERPATVTAAPEWPKKARMTVKGPDRVGLSVEVNERVRAKIERAMQLLPGSGVGDVLERAIDLLLAKVDPVARDRRRTERKARAAKRARPAASAPSAGDVSIEAQPAPQSSASPVRRDDAKTLPKALRDAVIARDGARCTFTAQSGHRCDRRHYLEVDHIHPRAFGGSHDMDNLRTLCSAHHRMYTAASFGPFRSGG